MRKIGFFNIGKLGLVKSAGTGKTDINKVIEKWIPKHMVFWYDMSKPVDVYTQNFNNWKNYNPNSVSITNNKIVVNGLIDNFRIASIGEETESFSVFIEGLGDKNLVYRVRLDENSDQITNIKLKDGENVLPHSFATTVVFMGVSGVTDYIGLTITQLPSGQSVPTNEILKTNPYLQDFSGNNRPLKLNNFLFAAMSGVGGYEYNWLDNSVFKFFIPERASGTYTDKSFHIQQVNARSSIVETKVATKSIGYKIKVSGLTSNEFVRYSIKLDGSTQSFDIKVDGEYELPFSDYEALYNMGYSIRAVSDVYPHTCNITVEQIPLYPNALVTDGVDDYGQVQNLSQGVKMLFMSFNIFSINKFIYDQRYDSAEPFLFAINNASNSIAYNYRNSNGTTYIDGTLNESTVCQELLNKRHIITIVNNNVTSSKSKTPLFFRNMAGDNVANMAFYNSIGFDAVPAKETDGFTEQDLIDYYIPKSIVTITVVDVNGAPIENATVTVGGVQYKTLSDGTVKVRGMVNGTMSLSVKKDGYMPFSDNSWKFADSRITLEVLRNTVITENGYSILLENDGLILTE